MLERKKAVFRAVLDEIHTFRFLPYSRHGIAGVSGVAPDASGHVIRAASRGWRYTVPSLAKIVVSKIGANPRCKGVSDNPVERVVHAVRGQNFSPALCFAEHVLGLFCQNIGKSVETGVFENAVGLENQVLVLCDFPLRFQPASCFKGVEIGRVAGGGRSGCTWYYHGRRRTCINLLRCCQNAQKAENCESLNGCPVFSK